jgi:hypothetical protein
MKREVYIKSFQTHSNVIPCVFVGGGDARLTPPLNDYHYQMKPISWNLVWTMYTRRKTRVYCDNTQTYEYT